MSALVISAILVSPNGKQFFRVANTSHRYAAGSWLLLLLSTQRVPSSRKCCSGERPAHNERGRHVLSGIFGIILEQAHDVQGRRVAPNDKGLLGSLEPEQEMCRYRCLTAAGVVPEERPHAAEHALEMTGKESESCRPRLRGAALKEDELR